MVCGETAAAPLEAVTTFCASCSSPGPHSTSDRRPWRFARPRATSAKYTGGQRLFGHAAPGLMMANGAPSGMPRRARAFVRDRRIPILERKLDLRHTDADGLQHRQVLVDDMRRRVARRLRIEKARGPLAQEVRGKSDDARRAGKAREHRRLQQTLQVERDIVARSPQVADHRPQRTGAARVDRNAAIDNRHELEHLALPHVDEPIDG